MKTIGDRIRQRRIELKLTQPDLAKLIGVSNGTVSMWETGINEPKGKNLFNAAAALKISPHYILTGEHPKEAGGPYIMLESQGSDPKIEEVSQIMTELSPEDRQFAVEMMRTLARRGLRE